VERHRSIPERNKPWPYVTSRIVDVDKVPLLPPRNLLQQVVKQRVQQRVRDRVQARRSGPQPTPPPPAKVARRVLRRLGLHPDDDQQLSRDLSGRRALVIATNHAQLDVGRPTGVFAS
ncbi:MAG: hypothetical protein ACO22B_11030, partial [Ilumatobacteraceae bacterium]